jgi:hypothetical protein
VRLTGCSSARVRLTATVGLLVPLLLSACAGGDNDDAPIVVVSRDWRESSEAFRERAGDFCEETGRNTFECLLEPGAREYHAVGAERATLSFPSSSIRGSWGNELRVRCAGQEFIKPFVNRYMALAPRAESRLDFEDGSAARLNLEQGLVVDDQSIAGDQCWEETGSWEGTAGDLVGRSGTYTHVYDSLQMTLTLTAVVSP